MRALLLALTLSGCATLPAAVDRVAEAQDDAVSAALLVICRGLSVGAW